MKNADMPAMPITLREGEVWSEEQDNAHGLTKREHFAAMAMQGLLSNAGGPIQHNPMSGTGYCNSDASTVAAWSLEMADALLAELDKEKAK